MRGIAHAEPRDVSSPDVSAVDYQDQIDTSGEPTAISDHTSGFAIHPHTEQRSVFGRMCDVALRPLVVLFTTQSVVVAVLVCLAAAITVQHASQVISEKFAAINAALKRF